jgi:hypothetical protein|tara:strand:- start:779 stop:1303 length:525 start_codon:yes stop_codon:yes gene_type:complete
MSGYLGHSRTNFEDGLSKLGKTNLDDVMRFLSGEGFAKDAQEKILEQLTFGGKAAAKGAKGGLVKLGPVARFAGKGSAKNILRAIPGLSTALVALDVADVIAGQDSLANRGMDAAAMGIGGTLGAVGGPLGIAAGAGLGKMVSDGTQFIFGGGKSAEQRKIEEAVQLLQQRGLV